MKGIVNRQIYADHYVEDIHDGFKFEVHVRDGVSYLLYKNRRGEVSIRQRIPQHSSQLHTTSL